MPNQNPQPTVLVKRSDGTFVRMSLDEVKKIRIQPGAAAKKSVPTAPATKGLSAPKKVNDFSVPLEELKKKNTLHSAPAMSQSRDSETEGVMKRLRFSVPKEHTNRLRTIIQLHLKDVRGVEQTKDALTRPALQGGLGLDSKQTEEVLKECDHVVRSAAAEPMPTLRELKQEAPRSLLPELYQEPPVPAVSTPHNAFIHDKLKSPLEGGSRGMLANVRRTSPYPPQGGITSQPAPAGNANIPHAPPKRGTIGLPPVNLPVGEVVSHNDTVPTFKLNSTPVAKPTMHDVVAPRMEIGPIEEIKYLSLADFRHIAPSPEEAASRLKQKLVNLRDESILLYLDGVAAWRQSPLYKNYITLVSQALATGTVLTAATGNKESLSVNECKALVGINRSLKL